MDVTAEIHGVSSNSYQRCLIGFGPAAQKAQHATCFVSQGDSRALWLIPCSFEFLALCVSVLQPRPAQPSELPSAAYFFLEQGPNQRVSWRVQVSFQKSTGRKDQKTIEKPDGCTTSPQDVALTKAALGREEDSSDDEEELMAHPWPRQLRQEDSAIDVCSTGGCCCATVQLCK